VSLKSRNQDEFFFFFGIFSKKNRFFLKKMLFFKKKNFIFSLEEVFYLTMAGRCRKGIGRIHI